MDDSKVSIGEIDKYELQHHLGSGAFGAVYLAHDRALNAIKAIKVLNAKNPHEVKKNLEEAQILHKCKHKNIVHVNEANIYEVGSAPHVVIDMEYLPLGSFENAIARSEVSIHGSISIIIDCLFALEHAHINGVLHRDIKPANIMLCEYGAKLSDFGLATVLGLSSAGSPQGYTTHLPPEYFITKSTTILTDIFAVGMTLFRACNYIRDWDRAVKSFPDPMSLIYSGSLSSSMGYEDFVPLKLKKIINKACSPSPNTRYQSASEFRQALERLKPSIDWIPNNDGSFTGHCRYSSDRYLIELSKTRISFNVDIKRNNRKQNAHCASFPDLSSARCHINCYIASTMFF